MPGPFGLNLFHDSTMTPNRNLEPIPATGTLEVAGAWPAAALACSVRKGEDVRVLSHVGVTPLPPSMDKQQEHPAPHSLTRSEHPSPRLRTFPKGVTTCSKRMR